MRALRGHDIPLYAAGLSFYSAVALVPLLLALGVAALVLGDATVVRLGDHLADAVPARHGFADSIRHLTVNPDGGGAAAIIGSVLIA